LPCDTLVACDIFPVLTLAYHDVAASDVFGHLGDP